MRRHAFLLALTALTAIFSASSSAQAPAPVPLTVDSIMRGPALVGDMR